MSTTNPTINLQVRKETSRKKLNVISHTKQKDYRVRVYANDDVYESTLHADRISFSEQSIIFYNKAESIIAVFPACKTEVLRMSE